MRKLFQSMDKNYDYMLTKEEFVDGLKSMGLADADRAAD